MIATHKKILLVEDDASLGYLLSEYLQMKDFEVVWEKDGSQVLELLDTYHFDLIVLDVMMPKLDGFTLATDIKRQFPNTPFIFLTARSLKIDVLKGFSLGAVDYLKKPIDEEELVVRINTLLNMLSSGKINESPQNKVEIGDYLFDREHLQLRHNNTVIQLTVRETELLYLLVYHMNDICSHKEILNSIWGKNDYFNKKSLNVFISRLRKYFKEDPSIKIENIHNQGFVLRVQK